MTVPLYGELASFGSGASLVTFPRNVSYLETNNRKRKTAYAFQIGQAYPVDLLGGGVGPLASPTVTFTYYILATTPALVEAAYNLLETQLQATNTDTTAGERNLLTVYLADGVTTAVAPARFEDCSPSVADRGPFHACLHISFTLLGPFV
jgi:hypothetical protein